MRILEQKVPILFLVFIITQIASASFQTKRYATLKTIDGEEYSHALIHRQEGDQVVVIYLEGIVKIPISALPDTVRTDLGFVTREVELRLKAAKKKQEQEYHDQGLIEYNFEWITLEEKHRREKEEKKRLALEKEAEEKRRLEAEIRRLKAKEEEKMRRKIREKRVQEELRKETESALLAAKNDILVIGETYNTRLQYGVGYVPSANALVHSLNKFCETYPDFAALSCPYYMHIVKSGDKATSLWAQRSLIKAMMTATFEKDQIKDFIEYSIYIYIYLPRESILIGDYLGLLEQEKEISFAILSYHINILKHGSKVSIGRSKDCLHRANTLLQNLR